MVPTSRGKGFGSNVLVCLKMSQLGKFLRRRTGLVSLHPGSEAIVRRSAPYETLRPSRSLRQFPIPDLFYFVTYVLLSLKVFAARANFPVVIQTISVQKRIHRGDPEYAEKRIL